MLFRSCDVMRHERLEINQDGLSTAAAALDWIRAQMDTDEFRRAMHGGFAMDFRGADGWRASAIYHREVYP